jgi:hypothetical protein
VKGFQDQGNICLMFSQCVGTDNDVIQIYVTDFSNKRAQGQKTCDIGVLQENYGGLLASPAIHIQAKRGVDCSEFDGVGMRLGLEE